MVEGSVALATVIGDVVDSRAIPDRPGLHARLETVLARANDTLQPVTELRITVGDEYQGAFATVGQAVHAALWLRLQLLPLADLRHGIGWGATHVLSEDPRVEDGPGWWAAREAIEAAEEQSERAAVRSIRAQYLRADGIEGPAPEPLNAALLCRDQLIAGADERSIRLLRGMLLGRTQTELAHEEGISPSAVSQRARNDGLAVILEADALLREIA